MQSSPRLAVDSAVRTVKLTADDGHGPAPGAVAAVVDANERPASAPLRLSGGEVNLLLRATGFAAALVSKAGFHPEFVPLNSPEVQARMREWTDGHGGGQEHGLRGGTEKRARHRRAGARGRRPFSQLHATAQHTERLAQTLFDALATSNGGAERLGHPERRLPHVLSMRLPGIVGATLQERMSARGVAFSIGAACHAHESEAPGRGSAANPVHEAIGLSRYESREVIRLSFSRMTTDDEVQRAGKIFAEEIATLRAQAPRRTAAQETANLGDDAIASS